MPIIATCIRGTEVHIRPLPSFVTKVMVPVSATAKLAPVMPISALANFSLNSPLAASVSSGMDSYFGVCALVTKSSETSSLDLCIAGATM